jgi:hypothetical protein
MGPVVMAGLGIVSSNVELGCTDAGLSLHRR